MLSRSAGRVQKRSGRRREHAVDRAAKDSMSTTELRGENRTDSLIAQHTTLGLDDDGYAHHLDRDARVVHRIDPATGCRERRSDLGAWTDERPNKSMGNAVSVYVHEYIGGEVGWTERAQMTSRDVFGRQA